MQCAFCRRELSVFEADGRSVRGCTACKHFWFPSAEAPRPRHYLPWVAALNFDPLRCPGCELAGLQLGSIGNQSVYKCAHCSGLFVFTPTISGSELAEGIAVGVLADPFAVVYLALRALAALFSH
jgi:hypothetical protein